MAAAVSGLRASASRLAAYPRGVVPPWPARRSRYHKPGHAGDGGPATSDPVLPLADFHGVRARNFLTVRDSLPITSNVAVDVIWLFAASFAGKLLRAPSIFRLIQRSGSASRRDAGIRQLVERKTHVRSRISQGRSRGDVDARQLRTGSNRSPAVPSCRRAAPPSRMVRSNRSGS